MRYFYGAVLTGLTVYWLVTLANLNLYFATVLGLILFGISVVNDRVVEILTLLKKQEKDNATQVH
jgi:hypothetical protein